MAVWIKRSLAIPTNICCLWTAFIYLRPVIRYLADSEEERKPRLFSPTHDSVNAKTLFSWEVLVLRKDNIAKLQTLANLILQLVCLSYQGGVE